MAGQTDEPIQAYEAALEVYPDYLPAIQALAVTTVRAGRVDARLNAWLGAIALRSGDARWRGWAQRERARIAD